MSKIKLIEEFIKKSENFWDEHLSEGLDSKHKDHLNSFKKKYEGNIDLYSKEIFEWEKQTDQGVPIQLDLKKIKIIGLKNYVILIIKFFKNIIFRNNLTKNEILDDLKIIEKYGKIEIFNDILIKERGHLKDIFIYKSDFDILTNNRWNRYVYLASRIIIDKLINKDQINWLDIGSYYGGLQFILKKYFIDSNFFLLDFKHQLCRSYVLLKKKYPNSSHIVVEGKTKIDINKINTFYYVPVSLFHKIKNIKFALISNFFSFGEMKRDFFEKYYKSDLFKYAEKFYLVNRFISAPYFEPTYDSDIKIIDYLRDDFKIKYLDIFPIGHYQAPKRELFGVNSKRPISSPYFEMILEKIK